MKIKYGLGYGWKEVLNLSSTKTESLLETDVGPRAILLVSNVSLYLPWLLCCVGAEAEKES